MRRLARAIVVASCTLVSLIAARPAGATIKYRISLVRNEQHLFQVEMEIPKTGKDTEVAMPAWNTLYQVRDFAYRLRNLGAVEIRSAGDSGRALALYSTDKQTWRIGPSPVPAGPADFAQEVVRYSIAWDDPGPFNSQLNAHHAFINLAQVLMYVPDRRSEDAEVTFDQLPPDWKLAAELPAGGVQNSFTAKSYDALVDAPVEAGKFSEFGFENQGARFRVVVDGTEWNKGRLEDFVRRITSYELRLMGGPPFKEYTFIFHLGPYADVGGGGMEHSNSTAISATSVESAAAVAAHEFFHAWNAKRIRPQSLEPVDYSREQYTRALWFVEGVTSTYGAYTLERTNLWTKSQFYDDLAMQIGEFESRPAHKWQSVEESSLDAWLEKYDAYNAPDRSISYYSKGQIDGLLLDLAIRNATDNQRSLDDVLRAMNAEYETTGRFYDDSRGIREMVERVSGTSFEEFFRRFVAGTDEIPYDDFLTAAGWELRVETTTTADLGFSPVPESSQGVRVSDLEPGSAAEAAGLRNGDVILSPRSEPGLQSLEGWLRRRAAGDPLALRVRRGGQEMDISFLAGSRKDRHYSVVEMPHPTDRQRLIRNGILRGRANE